MLDPKYENCSTTSSSYSSVVMVGSSIVSCPRALVFLRLMVSPKSLQAREKRPINACGSCCAKGMSQEQGKEDSEERWGKTHPCLTPLRMSRGLDELLLYCAAPFMLCGRIQLCSAILVGSRSLEESKRD